MREQRSGGGVFPQDSWQRFNGALLAVGQCSAFQAIGTCIAQLLATLMITI